MRIGDLTLLPSHALQDLVVSHEKELAEMRKAGKMPSYSLREYADVIISQARAILRSREHTSA